jgi:hypothetical protein
MSINQIMDTLPQSAKKKGLTLLQLIKPHLNWNQRGEIVIAGQPIPQSHISDLVKFTVVRYFNMSKPPEGFQYFSQKLQDLNIPQSLIINKVGVNTESSSWVNL